MPNNIVSGPADAASSNASVVKAIMSHYRRLARTPGYEWVRWSDKRRRFTQKDADAFLVGLMLDQGQDADRAWDKAQHLVSEYFQDLDNWWEGVLAAHPSTVRSICRTGYYGKSYAEKFQAPKFAGWLRGAARKVVDDYQGDPRRLWAVDDAAQLYWRLRGVPGIGDALAKMGQFILVRNYGVAGGTANRACMSAKPDVHVRRVAFRSGLAPSTRSADVIRSLETLSLSSPADFDAAVWDIGRRWCSPKDPACDDCAIDGACSKASL